MSHSSRAVYYPDRGAPSVLPPANRGRTGRKHVRVPVPDADRHRPARRRRARAGAMRLTDAERAMLDGAAGPAKQRAMDLLVRYGEALGAERLVAVTNVAGTWNATSPPLRPVRGARLRRGLLQVQPRRRRRRGDAAGGGLHLPAHPRHRHAQRRGDRRVAGTRRAAAPGGEVFRRARRADAQHLHALPGRQRAGARRALRLDGILRRRLLQRRARRAHQHGGARKRRRRLDHRADTGLGPASRRRTASARIRSTSASTSIR